MMSSELHHLSKGPTRNSHSLKYRVRTGTFGWCVGSRSSTAEPVTEGFHPFNEMQTRGWRCGSISVV